MLVLGINTAGISLSLTLMRDNVVVAHRGFEDRRGQSEVLLPLLGSVLREINAKANDLDGIAVVSGPGSFTGLRLGLSAALGLSRALGCPVTGFDRFSLLRSWAEKQLQDKGLDKTHHPAIILVSLRPELYVELEKGKPQMILADTLGERVLASPDTNTPDAQWVLIGDAIERIPHTISELPMPDEAELAAQRAGLLLAQGGKLPPATPYYLRAPDITLTKPA